MRSVMNVSSRGQLRVSLVLYVKRTSKEMRCIDISKTSLMNNYSNVQTNVIQIPLNMSLFSSILMNNALLKDLSALCCVVYHQNLRWMS